MGCAYSRLDDLPAVALCRDRCRYLDDALRYGHAFSAAHLAYMESLKSLAPALLLFFELNNGDSLISVIEPPESSLTGNSTGRSSSSSNSDSHIHFRSDTDEEDAEKENGIRVTIHENRFDDDNTYMNGAAPKLAPSPPPAGNPSWDFMNFFETYEKYEPLFASDQDGHGISKVESKNRGKEKKTTQIVGKGGFRKQKTESEKQKDSSVIPDMMKEIQMGFERARDSASEVSRLLCCRNGINPVISDYLVFDEDASISSQSLHSTLKKLWTWEKKLYAEVKAEERLRLALEKKCRQLKRLEERKTAGADNVDSARTLVRNLGTKLKISIQVVNRISTTISKLRDGDFWVLIAELIPGLLGMWRSMLDCHKNQHRSLTQAKSLRVESGEPNDDRVEAALRLKAAFENWNSSFSVWIETQKHYVKTLNGWLLRCLLHEPEETLDNPPPLSPGRIGAPSVFVTFHRWSIAMDKLSENPVIESINRFIRSLEALLNRFQLDAQERLVEEGKKPVSDKKTLAEAAESGNPDLCLNLKQIFMAMESFADESVRAYEDVCARMGL